MKNTIKTFIGLFLLCLAFSCSNDTENLVLEESTTKDSTPQAERGSYWDGIIATDKTGGGYTFVADTLLIKSDLEQMLRTGGVTTTLQTLSIAEKTADNDPADLGYMLIGSDNNGVSIGVMLARSGRNFIVEAGTVSSVACIGCTWGCNLSYLKFDGHKYAYCNANGCGANCYKSEASFN
ncbi:hypothetical protein [Flavobacterium rhizosphaerae]|uniref:Lipoprotein n=1 Tax=Flavobacterium rhizosphaerae TaxID=3163298 RepID=A0ABW8YVE5_9FLAO